MKRMEVSINGSGIHILRENPEPMSADQKFYIIMALLGLTAFLGFFGLLAAH